MKSKVLRFARKMIIKGEDERQSFVFFFDPETRQVTHCSGYVYPYVSSSCFDRVFDRKEYVDVVHDITREGLCILNDSK